jgi:hypothetical protein
MTMHRRHLMGWTAALAAAGAGLRRAEQSHSKETPW